MKCFSRILDKQFAKRLPHQCLTGVRSYSFASEIQTLLTQFDSESSVPPIVPASQKVLSSFHRDVLNSKVSTWYLTRRFNDLRKNSSLRALPSLTAKAYLQRLFAARDFEAIVNVLLDYDLGDAVVMVAGVLSSQSPYQVEYSLCQLYERLSGLQQGGLATQILIEVGLTSPQRDAVRSLVFLQSRINACPLQELSRMIDICREYSSNMRKSREASVNAYSADSFMKRAIRLGDLTTAKSIYAESWFAEEASTRYLGTLSNIEMLDALEEQVRRKSDHSDISGMHKLWKHVIERQHESHGIERIARCCPADVAVQQLLSLQAASISGSFETALRLMPLLDVQDAASVIYRCLESTQGAPDQLQLLQHRLPSVFRSFSETTRPAIFDRILQSIKQSTSGRFHLYPYEKLHMVLAVLRDTVDEIPQSLQEKLTKHMLHRSAGELLAFDNLDIITSRLMMGIINHHLRAIRLNDQNSNSSNIAPQMDKQLTLVNHDYPLVDSAVFANLVIQGRGRELKANTASQTFYEIYGAILLQLAQLKNQTITQDFLRTTRATGIEMTPDLASKTIRILAREPTNEPIIVSMLLEYGTDIMTYDIWARYMSRIAEDCPRTAMSLMRAMLVKGLVPGRRLLQNLMLSISRSMSISNSRAFRYLAVLSAIGDKSKIGLDRVALSAYMRVVLLRQGLGASTLRLNWLLSHSSRVAKRSGQKGKYRDIHNDLLDLLTRWNIYERSRGSEVNQQSLSTRRPKKLREMVEILGARKSVIGRGGRDRDRARGRGPRQAKS